MKGKRERKCTSFKKKGLKKYNAFMEIGIHTNICVPSSTFDFFGWALGIQYFHWNDSNRKGY